MTLDDEIAALELRSAKLAAELKTLRVKRGNERRTITLRRPDVQARKTATRALNWALNPGLKARQYAGVVAATHTPAAKAKQAASMRANWEAKRAAGLAKPKIKREPITRAEVNHKISAGLLRTNAAKRAAGLTPISKRDAAQRAAQQRRIERERQAVLLAAERAASPKFKPPKPPPRKFLDRGPSLHGQPRIIRKSGAVADIPVDPFAALLFGGR